MDHRDKQVRSVIGDGVGLHELLRTPSFVSISHNLCAHLIVFCCVVGNLSSCRPPCPAPAVGGSGKAGPSTSNSRAASAAPQLQSRKVTDYLVGPQLHDAVAAGQQDTVSCPFVEGQISDFMQQRCSGTSIYSTLLVFNHGN
jgi:actin-related protein 9